MWPAPSLSIEGFGWLVVHHLWMGALVGVVAVFVRWACPGATPGQRYAFSLCVLAVLLFLGAGLALAIFVPLEFWNLSRLLPMWTPPEWFLGIVPLLPAVWAGVSFLLLAVLVLGMVGIWRLRFATASAPRELRELADGLALRMQTRLSLAVRICERIGEPILLGICRPLILLPSAVLTRCRPEQLELILLHELAHIRRRDNLVLLIQRTAEVLFWFQPAVWMVSRWITRDREFCCDQFVLKQTGDRKLYAETLIALAGLARPRPAPFLAAFFGREHVFARIRYILNSEEAAMSRSRSLAQAGALGFAAVVGLSALVSPERPAAADPPVPSAVPFVPAEVVPPTPSVVVPAPVISQPAQVLPPTYTQKPELILNPGNADQPPPQSDAIEPLGAQNEPQAVVVTPTAKRAWGPEQAEGPPDTEGAGDIQSAWASQTQDAQKEWLICEYAEAVLPKAVEVYETYNPGSLEKVTVFGEDGTEHEAWTGTDPTPRTAMRGTSIIPIKTKFKIKKVKLFFDSPAVPGWNEIDAVGLREEDNEVQWAEKVTASTTYAQDIEPVPSMVVVPLNQLQQLEQEVKSLKEEVQRLKQMEADIKEMKELLKGLKEK